MTQLFGLRIKALARAGNFENKNNSSTIVAFNFGTGNTGYFENKSTGRAGYFENNSKDKPTIEVRNNSKESGFGRAGNFYNHSDAATIGAFNESTGKAGNFENNSNDKPTVYAINNGKAGVWGVIKAITPNFSNPWTEKR